jgi:hypothetical protein
VLAHDDLKDFPMTTTQPITVHDRRRMQVRPSEIRSGDLMRDLGRLCEVERIESLDGEITSATLYLVCFKDRPGDIGSFGVREATQVTIWRKTEC